MELNSRTILYLRHFISAFSDFSAYVYRKQGIMFMEFAQCVHIVQ